MRTISTDQQTAVVVFFVLFLCTGLLVWAMGIGTKKKP